MKAEDYLTQEMIDNLQDNLDNNNGAIEWDDIEPLLNGFKEQLILSGVVVPKDTLKTNKGKCPCKMPFSQTWCEEHERWT